MQMKILYTKICTTDKRRNIGTYGFKYFCPKRKNTHTHTHTHKNAENKSPKLWDLSFHIFFSVAKKFQKGTMERND